jgi:hypothetical protein
MATFPSKPWSDGQTYEVIPGQTFQYSASKGTWDYITNLANDSDTNVEIARIDADISAIQSDISSLQSSVSALNLVTDSDAARISANVAAINAAYAMLD